MVRARKVSGTVPIGIQKLLKDRKGRDLTFEDIFHYQKIIVALTETHRLMQEIDRMDVE